MLFPVPFLVEPPKLGELAQKRTWVARKGVEGRKAIEGGERKNTGPVHEERQSEALHEIEVGDNKTRKTCGYDEDQEKQDVDVCRFPFLENEIRDLLWIYFQRHQQNCIVERRTNPAAPTTTIESLSSMDTVNFSKLMPSTLLSTSCTGCGMECRSMESMVVSYEVQ